MDFQIVARPHHVGASWEKNVIFAIKVWYPGSHSGCVPTLSKNFPDRSRITGSLLQRKHGGTDWNVCLLFPESVGAFPKVTQSGDIVTEKWPSSKHFQAMCYSQDTECWENYVPSVNERHQKRMWFQASIRNCQDSQMLELQVCTEDLISRSVQYVSLHFHSLLNTFLAQTGTVHEETGRGVCLRMLSPIFCC